MVKRRQGAPDVTNLLENVPDKEMKSVSLPKVKNIVKRHVLLYARFVLNKPWRRNNQDSVSQMLIDLN